MRFPVQLVLPAVLPCGNRAPFLLLATALLLSLPHAYAQDERIKPRVLWQLDLKSPSYGGGAIADLKNDGTQVLVFGTYFNDEHVYAVRAKDGKILWKFKSEGGPFDASVALVDVDGDRKLETLVADSSTGTLFCLNAEGEVVWKSKLPSSTDSPPAVADLDRDGTLEIVVGTMTTADRAGRVVVLDAKTGKERWSQKIPGHVQSEAVLEDLNGDGVLDAIVTNWLGDRKVRALNGKNGSELWAFSMNRDIYHGVSVFRLDRQVRIVATSTSGEVVLLNAAGNALWRRTTGGYLFAPSTLADLDGDGVPEIIVADARVHVFNVHGTQVLRGPHCGSIPRGAVAADINGDKRLDLIFGASDRKLRGLDGRQGKELFAFDATVFGKVYEGIDSAPLVSDFDGDGRLDVFFVCGRGLSDKTRHMNYGRAFAITLGPGIDRWTMFRGNLLRTGSLLDLHK